MDNLDSLATRLLDLGKRNKLLNYKDSGYKGITVIGDTNKIFDNIKNSKLYNIFKIDLLLEKFNKDLVIDSKETTLNFSIAKVKDIAEPALKSNDLLCYKEGYKTNQVIKRLYKEYQFSLTEKGINSLYITFGMLLYKEKNETYKAPILLIPLYIENINGIYKIHEYEDEIILNPTLKYLLKTSYKIDLPEYHDEMSYNEYIDLANNVNNKEYTIDDSMTIGIYSFLKMNMYNDLHDNQEEILKNNNVNVLLGKSSPINNKLVLDSLPIVNCDSSQLEAVREAVNGNSFVLEGPPGSGKSQTITNIIGSIIGQNKKVLFVSEKLAALNVVYENLKRANLADFAIEIHSHKANKKDFITNLYNTAILPKYDINDYNSKNLLESYQIESDIINSYYIALHKIYPTLNMSLYDAYKEYLGIDVNEINYKLDIDISNINEIARLLDEFISLSNSLCYDYRKSIFYGFKVDNEYLRYDFKKDVEESYNFLAKIVIIKDNLNNELKTDISNPTSLIDVLNTLSVLVSLKMYDPCYLIKSNRVKLTKLLESYFEVAKELKSNQIISNYNTKIILDTELEDKYLLLKTYSQSFFKFLNNKYKNLKREILAYRSSSIKIDELLIELESLIKYKEKLNELNEIVKKINSITDISEDEYPSLFDDITKLEDSSFDIKLSKDRFKEIKDFITDVLISFDSIKTMQIGFIKFSSRFDYGIKNLFEYSIDQSLNIVKELDIESNKIGFYFNLCNVIDKLRNYNVMKFVDDYLDNHYELNEITLQFKKCLYKTKIFDIIDKDINLANFNSTSFSMSVEEFDKLDESLLEANKAYIFSLNTKNRPNDDVVVAGSMFSTLVHENNKQRKQKPIRLLLEEIFTLATAVKPIFLMSPLSVSVYLPSKADLFDCVIFDEASQIFSYDAIGSIYRAKQCIIIGDTKQMPPSNFFNSTVEDDEDSYDDTQESILDLATSKFKSSRLKWHYRSRSEELIAFSNERFYNHSLITIPQAKKHTEGFGIDFYYLNNGIYLDNRTNYVEANFIKDMVINHVKNSDMSIGVIAFSNQQASLIEDLIENERINNPDLEKYFIKYKEEPFFVKNLETVQGDERDVIIFSICYGYNSNNKFYQRFGPLNNLGGEKRLNVAITRAKYNIRIVSSILSSDINDKNTDSLGVKLLKAYLAYAKDVNSYTNHKESNDNVVNSIKKYIESLGYDVDTNLGNSSFKIDLAVSKNDNNILAIELDNDDASISLTDNLRLHKLLLERLGWRYIAIYSTEWILNQEAEMKRIKEALEDNIAQEDLDNYNNSFLVEFDDDVKLNNYVFVDYEKLKKLLDNNYSLGVKYLVEIEGPIHIEYMYKCIAKALDRKVSNVVKNNVNAALGDLDLANNGIFYYLGNKEIKFRANSKLDLKYISREELEDGIYNIIKNNNGITVLGCYKELIKEIGLGRLTEEMKNYLDDIIVFLKLDGKITQRNESLFI